MSHYNWLCRGSRLFCRWFPGEAEQWSRPRVLLVFHLIDARLCRPPGCLLSVHSCPLKLAAPGSRCWKRMSLSSTVSRLSQVFYTDLLLLSCCFKQNWSQFFLPFRDKIHCIGRPSSIWYWCSFEENLWDLFRFCPQKPFLLSRNANQVGQRWQMAIVSQYSGVMLNVDDSF